MECVFVLIVIVAIIAAVASQKQATSSSANDAYSRLSGRVGGHFTRGGWWRRPSVHFTWHGAPALFDVHSTGGAPAKHATQLQIAWPDNEASVEVYPAGMWSRTKRVLGAQAIRVNNAPFDEQYTINATSPEMARRTLSSGVQWHIDRISRLFHNGDVYFRIEHGTLLIRKRPFMRTYSELEQFGRLALELYEQALLTQTHGIQIVAGELPAGPPMCKVCGETIDVVEMVNCGRCETPHHRECWHYFGACSVYGCGETRYVDAPRSPLVNGHLMPAPLAPNPRTP